MIKKLLLFILVAVSINTAMAQFSIDAEIRTRGEYRDGYKTIPRDAISTNAAVLEATTPLAVVAQRSRLIANYRSKKFEAKLNFQDARIWGQFGNANSAVGLYEAWVKYKFNKVLALQVGRMPLAYDDERILGAGNWRTQAKSNDLARLIIFSKKLQMNAHLGFAINNDFDDEAAAFQAPYFSNDRTYKNLAYLWINKKFFNKALELSLVGINEAKQYTASGLAVVDTALMNRMTLGAYLKFKKGMFFVEGAYYQQLGKDTYGKSVNANFYSALAMVEVSEGIRLGAGYDHYSGTDLSGDRSENNTFQNTMGSKHKFLGWMDYFTTFHEQRALAGVNDVYAKASIKLNNKNKLVAFYHLFSLDQGHLEYHDLTTGHFSVVAVDKSLGSEIDLVYSYKVNPDLVFSLGYSTMLYTKSMETLKNIPEGTGNFAHFGWLQMTYKPNFFTYKKGSSKRSSRQANSFTKPTGRKKTKAKKSERLERKSGK